ncbi:hypothetical protein AB0M39_29500 [Streptomyces sp. NPDC051907]|uniref:hypothetical protein n=1 Tax=Streptomyces sp. NPDC051907 TaxID=3155284 RepID=UPI0034423E5C
MVIAAGASQGTSHILLMIILVGLITAAGLFGYGGSTLARRGDGRSGTGGLLRSLAAFAGAATAALYVWGSLHLLGAFLDTEGMGATTFQECLDAGGAEKAAKVDGYEVEYLPIRYVCRIDEGGSYTAAVPGYVNPAMLASAASAVALAVAAAVASERRDRAAFQAETSGP